MSIIKTRLVFLNLREMFCSNNNQNDQIIKM